MRFESKRFGLCEVREISQRDLETYLAAVNIVESESQVAFDGRAVRQGAKQQLFISGPQSESEVDGMNPGRVRWLSDCLAKTIQDALVVDPLP